MQTEMTEAGPFERMLTLTLEESELDSAKEVAARKLSGDMKIKGFRPGKAPRAVVERMVGAEALRSEAIDEALPEAVGNALREADLSPVTTPRVEDMRDIEGGGVDLPILDRLSEREAVIDLAARDVDEDGCRLHQLERPRVE